MEPEGTAERRRDRVAAILSTRFGMVAMLIAMVLITQAGLVYVAVDQIDTSDPSTLIQPATRSTTTRPPISVDPEDSAAREIPAPAVTRAPDQVQAEPEGPPTESGIERAREQAEPRGVAPPLTGSEPPSRATQPDRGPSATSEPEAARPGRSEAPAASNASETATEASTQPTGEPTEEQHPGRGPEGDGPPGQDQRGEDRPDAGNDRGRG